MLVFLDFFSLKRSKINWSTRCSCRFILKWNICVLIFFFILKWGFWVTLIKVLRWAHFNTNHSHFFPQISVWILKNTVVVGWKHAFLSKTQVLMEIFAFTSSRALFRCFEYFKIKLAVLKIIYFFGFQSQSGQFTIKN